jgi:hypothetical protein
MISGFPKFYGNAHAKKMPFLLAMVSLKIDVPPIASFEISKLVRADGFTVELDNAEVEPQEHALDLVVEAFVDGEAAGSF